MRYAMFVFAAFLLTACSEAERSATTPAPKAAYVAPHELTDAEAAAQATRVCNYYHSEPAVSAGQADALARFECDGRARGGSSFFVERMGI